MNRYIFEGITADLHRGKSVIIVAPTTRQSSFTFREIADAFEGNGLVDQIRRTNGQESITMRNGGRLTFLAINMQGGRGMNPDTVVVMSSEHLTHTQVRAVIEYANITQAELIQA